VRSRLAALPPAGPVFVSLPMDDFGQEAEAAATGPLAARRVAGRALPDPAELDRLAGRLTAARNPVLVVGAGLDAAPGGFEAAVALAERQHLPVWLAPDTSGSRSRPATRTSAAPCPAASPGSPTG
jgi:benzoylformate decarboxylase